VHDAVRWTKNIESNSRLPHRKGGAKQEIVIKDSVIAVQDKRIVLKDSTIGLYMGLAGQSGKNAIYVCTVCVKLFKNIINV